MKMKRSVAVHIAVMDYACGDIRMYTARLSQEWTDDDVVNWLLEHDDNYRDSTCDYMCSEDEIEVLYE